MCCTYRFSGNNLKKLEIKNRNNARSFKKELMLQEIRVMLNTHANTSELKISLCYSNIMSLILGKCRVVIRMLKTRGFMFPLLVVILISVKRGRSLQIRQGKTRTPVSQQVWHDKDSFRLKIASIVINTGNTQMVHKTTIYQSCCYDFCFSKLRNEWDF